MAANNPLGVPERASFRVSYPQGYPEKRLVRAVLEPDLPVGLEDWSETGLRVQVPDNVTLAINDVVRFRLTPHAFEAMTVEGIVVRIVGCFVSVRLNSPGLPWNLMLHEQRAIRAWLGTTAEISEEIEAKARNSRRTIDELS
ncbi:MAG: PilZ domain-containing protein [bacterium]